MIRHLLPAALLATTLLTTALASPAAAQPVADKPVVTLDPTFGYIMVQSDGATAMSFIRLPEPADFDDYRKRRGEALTKAHDKWFRKHERWAKDAADYRALSPEARARVIRPVEPIEPTDANLAFTAIEMENLIGMGPFNRFSKANDTSTYLTQVRPGRYAFYGSIIIANGVAGTCMCMGTFEFEVKPGQIVNAGAVVLNWLEERQRAKAEKREVPHTDMDLPETLNTLGWKPAVAGAPVDPRLAAYTIIPAELHASRRFPNYFGVQVDRITPIPGVIAYDRDKIVDERTGKVVGAK